SLLRARKSQTDNLDEWFSARSKECDVVSDSSPFTQVARQVLSLRARADKFVEENQAQVVTLEYAEMCQAPLLAMKKIQQFCKGLGINLNMRNTSGIPQPYLPNPRIDDDYKAIQEALFNDG
ncbi:MAG: hypothetical protein QGF46_00335, partial [Planctomycetota bacterium]|nr:hypothetical protein [Planctomycetota bacterium]